jgi:hypothetical protein
MDHPALGGGVLHGRIPSETTLIADPAGDAGSWALSATPPMTQHNKVFLLLFVHKKKPFSFA